MKPKLKDEDRRALDLLLDRSPTAAGRSAPVFAAADAGVRDRLPRVQKVLHLLDALPADEPPKDLVARTMEFIENPIRQRRIGRGARDLMPVVASNPPA
jgi:hypothetical protein